MDKSLINYYRKQQFVPGWQDLSALLFTGILQAVDNDEGRAFLRTIGSDLARRFPLNAINTLGELEDSVNALLARFSWGMVRLGADECGMTITHEAYPHAGQQDALPLWIVGFSALMEGCWYEWLRLLGGAPDVAFFLTDSSPDKLNFRYQYEPEGKSHA